MWDYIKGSDEYIRVILSLSYVLEKNKFLTIDKQGKLILTEKGLSLIKYLSIKKEKKPFKKIYPGYGFELNKKFKRILSIMKELYKEVTPQHRYDQAPLVPEDTVQKIAYIIYKGDATNKNVVCIGDDDLTSIILALSKSPRKILVIDIDKYLLELIEDYAYEHKLPIETLEMDLRKPIPEEYKNKFDLFITEPPDTVNGITLFTSRGVELLKGSQGMIGYCGISVCACPPLGLLEIQRILTEMGLLITDRLPKFSRYPPHRTELKHVEVPDFYDDFYPPKKIWYVSDLVRLKTTNKTKPYYKGIFKQKLANYSRDSQIYR